MLLLFKLIEFHQLLLLINYIIILNYKLSKLLHTEVRERKVKKEKEINFELNFLNFITESGTEENGKKERKEMK